MIISFLLFPIEIFSIFLFQRDIALLIILFSIVFSVLFLIIPESILKKICSSYLPIDHKLDKSFNIVFRYKIFFILISLGLTLLPYILFFILDISGFYD